eukprot:1987631-Amphidinium_carterae.2
MPAAADANSLHGSSGHAPAVATPRSPLQTAPFLQGSASSSLRKQVNLFRSYRTKQRAASITIACGKARTVRLHISRRTSSREIIAQYATSPRGLVGSTFRFASLQLLGLAGLTTSTNQFTLIGPAGH